MAITYLSGGRIQGSSTAVGSDEEIILDDNPSSQYSWGTGTGDYAPSTPTPSNHNNYNGVRLFSGSALKGKKLKKVKAWLCKVGSPNTSGTIRIGVMSDTQSGSTRTWVTNAYVDIQNLISGESTSGAVTLNTGFPATAVPIEITLPTPHTLAENDTIALACTGGNYSDSNCVAWHYSDGNAVYDGQNTTRNRFTGGSDPDHSGGAWNGSAMASDMHCTLTCESIVDEKATITDVPEGTRYEETNTRKIYRRVIGALDNETGLRFRYKFDEASGDVKNYGSVADADLTVSGLTRDVTTPSGIGNGMSTPNRNSNDYAQNTSRVNDYKFMHDGTAKWSVTFWAYLTEVPTSSTNTEHACMGNIWTDDAGIGWTIRWAYDVSPNSSTSCRIQTFIAESNTTGSATMPLNDQTPNAMMPELNAWHFYCVTYDPTLGSDNLTVSRDAATTGTGFHQGDEDNDTYSSSNPTRKVTYFSRPTSSYDLGMGGRLAEVTIWEDKILTQAEKVALYASGNGTSKLSSSWKEKGTA